MTTTARGGIILLYNVMESEVIDMPGPGGGSRGGGGGFSGGRSFGGGGGGGRSR